MYGNRLHASWPTHTWLAALLSSLIARWRVGPQTLWWFRIKDLSIDERVRAWSMLCLWSGPPGFNCWISFIPVFSCMYCWILIFVLLIFISWFVCTWRWYIYKLGIFHGNQKIVSEYDQEIPQSQTADKPLESSIYLDPHQKFGWGWYCQTFLSPPVIFLLTIPRRCFFYGSFFIICVSCLSVILSCLFLAALLSPATRADLLALF